MRTAFEMATPGEIAGAPAAARAMEPSFPTRRLNREWKTMTAMIRIYCRGNHGAHRTNAGCAGAPLDDRSNRHGKGENCQRDARQHADHGDALCPECQQLQDYAAVRLDRCRFGTEKPTCAKCPVHCYQRTRREQIRAVMRYAGPRMLWRHPVLSLFHWIDGRRKVTLH